MGTRFYSSFNDCKVKHGAACEGSRCTLCSNGPCKASADATFWGSLADSAFCLEPPGDTLTRSHVYAAILSGCVPVMFDGGVDDFSAHEPTWWPFRQLPGEHALNWDFAVFSNATEVLAGKDLIAELLRMPSKDPKRYAALRASLDREASALRYAAYDPEDNGESPDAFGRFVKITKAAADWEI